MIFVHNYFDSTYIFFCEIGKSNQNESHLSKEDLLAYAQKAFAIDEETHQKLLELASDEKVTPVTIN